MDELDNEETMETVNEDYPGVDLAALKRKHGQISEVTLDEDEAEQLGLTGQIRLIVRKPTRGEVNQFAHSSTKKGKTIGAFSAVVHKTALYPDKDTINGWFAKAPGLPMSIGNEVLRLVGAVADFSTRRL